MWSSTALGVWQKILGCWTLVLFLSFLLRCQHGECVGQSGQARSLWSAFRKSTSWLSWFESISKATSEGCNDRSTLCSWSLHIKMQKGIRLNDGHVTYLGLLAKKDGTRRGCLSKKSSDNTKWHTKWFALLQNMLFYFENESSSRPSGLYLLEGCICDRAPSPKPSQSAKECLEKQVWRAFAHARTHKHKHTDTGSLAQCFGFQASCWYIDEVQHCFLGNLCLRLERLWTLFQSRTKRFSYAYGLFTYDDLKFSAAE